LYFIQKTNPTICELYNVEIILETLSPTFNNIVSIKNNETLNYLQRQNIFFLLWG